MSNNKVDPPIPLKSSPYQLTSIKINIDLLDNSTYSEVYLCSHMDCYIREAYHKSVTKYKINIRNMFEDKDAMIMTKETYLKIKATGFLKLSDHKKSFQVDGANHYITTGYYVLYDLFIHMCKLSNPELQFIHVPCEEYFL